MYFEIIVGVLAWIARNLQNMEDSIFGPKPAKHINIDDSDSDAVDANDTTPSIIENSDVEIVKLSKKKNCNKLSRKDLIKLLDFITLKLPNDLPSYSLHDVNDKATDKLFKSFVNITNDKGKAVAVNNSAMTIHSKMSLHAFGNGSTGYSSIWRNNIKNFRSQIISNNPVITLDSTLTNTTDIIGTSQANIAGIVSISINNTISIDPSHGAKLNEPSWKLLPIPPTMTQTMHLWKFRKKQALAFYICASGLLKTKRDDAGIPILPAYDDQLRVIIVGEAGVGKSHVLRSLMWFAYQHGWADSTVVTSYQGRPVSNLRNPAVRGMTSCMLHQINARANNSGRSNATSKTNLMNNFAKLVLDITDECSLTSADHFDACNKQAHRGLCNRDIIDSPFGGLHKILCMDPLQHTPVGGGPLWYGESNSVQQAYLSVRQQENAPAQHKLLGIAAGTALFQQFTTVVVLDEQMRQDDDIPGAKELHTLLQCIRKHGITQEIFEQLNSRAINNKQKDIPNHVYNLVNPAFIVPRHTLIDIINREIVPFKAKLLNKRLVLFYADITTQDNDNVGHELPFQILNLARKRPKKGKFIYDNFDFLQ